MRLINGVQTVPMNGWRSRKLAEYYFNDYNADGKFYEGMRFLVPAHVLKDMPDFDSKNQAYVDQFTGNVICEVVEEDSSYGFHISVEAEKSAQEMREAYTRWADYLKLELKTINKRKVITLYFRDIRPEDRITSYSAESIRGAELLINEKNLCNYGAFCESDLMYRIIELYGDDLQKRLERACVL